MSAHVVTHRSVPPLPWHVLARHALCAAACASSALVASAQTTPKPGPAPAPGPAERQAFTIAQSISDEAQLKTLAFSGLAMMTGNLESQSFFPPGKVADYTGFQYLRDNDPDGMGHNTSFLTRVANNVIYILDDSQFEQLKTLAVSQLTLIDQYGYKRFPLMKAFRRLLDDDLPSGSSGLDLEAVKQASRELYLIDGEISFDRARLYATVIRSMTSQQRAYLDAMKGHGWNSWPDISREQVDAKMRGLPQGTSVAVMTYASDLFSWYAGSVEADVYFCPERHGTYFGGFYIKDAPAIGHEGYSIDEQLTATAGEVLSDSSKGYVTPAQAEVMASLVERQRGNLFATDGANIVQVRTEIATLLRTLLTSTASADAVKARVLELSAIYGNLDGENNYHYATAFAEVYHSLSSGQKAQLAALRTSIMSGTYSDGTPFDFSVCTTPFLYSAAITNTSVLEPYVSNTDYLFFLASGLRYQRYFAEGATTSPFNCRFALVNPGTTTATAWLRFLKMDGTPAGTSLSVPALTRRTVDAKSVSGLEAAAFSTVVASDVPLVAERTMTWDATAYGAHSETSIAEPSETWFLAEGSTVGGFNLFYLLQNPNEAAAEVRVRYLRPSGAPIDKLYTLPAASRTNIWVNREEFAGALSLASTDVSASIQVLNGQPIIVERAMYLDGAGQFFAAGHESAGVTSAATDWFLAEGATGPFFDLFVLVANPNEAATTVEVRYLLPDGSTISTLRSLAASSRATIWVDEEDARLADTPVCTIIHSIDGAPIVVERAMWWPGSGWYEAHNAAGATETGLAWAVADGEVGGARATDTYILVANTSDAAGRAKVTLLFEDGTSVAREFPVAAHSRFNVDARADFPAAVDQRFGALVESTGATPVSLVVERATYWSLPGQPWAAGTNAMGTRLQ